MLRRVLRFSKSWEARKNHPRLCRQRRTSNIDRFGYFGKLARLTHLLFVSPPIVIVRNARAGTTNLGRSCARIATEGRSALHVADRGDTMLCHDRWPE